MSNSGMKFLIVTGIFLVFSTLYAQNVNEATLTLKVDSIQSCIDNKLKEIESLEIELRLAQAELNKYYLEREIGAVYVCTMGTVLKESPDGTRNIGRINRGDKVKLVEIHDDFYKVYFNGKYGYVLKSGFKEEIKLQDEAEQKKKLEQQKIEWKQQLEKERKEKEALRKKDLLNKYGQTNGLKIFIGEIWIGMTKSMLLDSRGRPDDINRTVGTWGVHEQWVYGSTYVYLENDILTSWQD